MHAFWWWFFFIFFVTHIPTTLIIDAQPIFGEHYPQTLQDFVAE